MDLHCVLEVVLPVLGFLAFFIKVVDIMGQILTCWIFAYSIAITEPCYCASSEHLSCCFYDILNIEPQS